MPARERRVKTIAERAAPVAFRGVYAWQSEDPPLPEHAAAGCPRSNWIHEGQPPWRVITGDSPGRLHAVLHEFDVAEYDGVEATVDLDAWWAE